MNAALKRFVKGRPSYFWPMLASLLAIVVIVSFGLCRYFFQWFYRAIHLI